MPLSPSKAPRPAPTWGPLVSEEMHSCPGQAGHGADLALSMPDSRCVSCHSMLHHLLSTPVPCRVCPAWISPTLPCGSAIILTTDCLPNWFLLCLIVNEFALLGPQQLGRGCVRGLASSQPRQAEPCSALRLKSHLPGILVTTQVWGLLAYSGPCRHVTWRMGRPFC